MRQSELFTKTRKETPAGEISKNADLLIRGGYIDKLQAGVYSYLPLGLRVLKNIENIVREEMVKVGGQELLLPALHPRENWEKTGRWESMDDLFRFTSYYSKIELALGGTHEEVLVPLVKKFISSYKDLPFAAFQIQNKFRDEKRAKSGILRGREFLMKDMYSFHRDEADLKLYYDVMKKSYGEIFKRCGIGHKTYVTYASGGTFSKYSHEFQAITPAGEDTIYICDRCSLAINKEIKDELAECPECKAKTFKEEKAIEVGNIFELKTKFSDPFDLKYKDEKGELQSVIMGCYGIGIGRVMGAIVEVLSDDKGIIWPASVAPYKVHLVELGGRNTKSLPTGQAGETRNPKEAAEKLYGELRNAGVQVLYDDRDASAGVKFNDADLLGMPWRVVVSEKTLAKDEVEVAERATGAVTMLKLGAVASELK